MSRHNRIQQWLSRIGIAAVTVGVIFGNAPSAMASFTGYSSENVTLGSNASSATNITYTFTMSGVNTTSAVKCILVQFGTSVGNASLPTGMSTASTLFDASSNYIPTPASWTIDNTSAATGLIKLTYTTGETPASATNRTLVFTGITNSSSANTYYASVRTFGNTDCATTPLDGGTGPGGTAAFVITNAVAVDGSVVPTLTYSVGSSAGCASLATLTSGAATTCSHTIAVTSNAASGYTLSYAAGSTTMVNQRPGHSSETIAAIGSSNAASSPGTAQFGINVVSNSSPSVGLNPSGGSGAATVPYGTTNMFAFEPSVAHQIASTSAASATTTYTVSYLVNISTVTPPGTYKSTVIYNVVANY